MAHAMGSMVHVRTWTMAEFSLMLGMWAVMMVAMMAPSAAPMTLVYAAVARKAAREGHPVAPTFVFVAGYLAMWGLFSVAATAAQRSLDQLALLSPTMVSASPLFGSALLVGAGVYELTPYKHACLTQFALGDLEFDVGIALPRGVLQNAFEPGAVDGLLDEVVCAHLDGLHRGLHVPLRGEHHHGERQGMIGQPLQQLQPIHSWHF